ncbi:MAG: hypothetical protein EXR07_09595 [Acetobacteraceae bacterium]|nr:hypothetical protein [Acetobacteraceae bacterium]
MLGRQAQNSSLYTVKAYRGPLPANYAGIEFWTIAAPPDNHPYAVWWYLHDLDVWDVTHEDIPNNPEQFAMIVVKVVKVVLSP